MVGWVLIIGVSLWKERRYDEKRRLNFNQKRALPISLFSIVAFRFISSFIRLNVLQFQDIDDAE